MRKTLRGLVCLMLVYGVYLFVERRQILAARAYQQGTQYISIDLILKGMSP